MIAVTFALPQESRDFIHEMHHSGPAGEFLLGNLGVEEIVVAHTGVGRAAAEKTVRAFVRRLGWKGKTFTISALTGEGCRELTYAIMDHLERETRETADA